MGLSTEGYIEIELQSTEDADLVNTQIGKIKELVEARTKLPAYFCLYSKYVSDTTFNCKVSSNRVQNGEFQIDQVVEEVKRMVKNKEILAPVEFTAELTTQYASWHIEKDEFLSTKDYE